MIMMSTYAGKDGEIVSICRGHICSKIKINDPKCCWNHNALKKKAKTFRKYKHSNSQILWERYRETRRYLKSATRRKYHEFLSTLQGNLKENPKLFWSFYRAKTKTNRIPNTVYMCQEIVSNSIEKAELFNKFFCSVYLKPEDQPS